MTTKTVWVVEQGVYSDYRVVGVFSSQANAQQIADAINAPGSEYKCEDEATIAEWPLNPAVRELRQGYRRYSVQMQEDGTVDRCDQQDISGYRLPGSARIWRRSTAPAYAGMKVADVLQADVWAKDERHAIKIANEHRTRLLANRNWYDASLDE